MARYLILIIFLLAGGCAWHNQERAEVTTGSPVVYIHPVSATDLSKKSVVIPPFLVPEGIDIRQGESVAALFQDVLLGKQAFQRVKLEKTHYGSLEEAIRLGKEAGVDFVLAGQVHTLLSGTNMGGGRVDLAVRLIHVTSGDTMWYIQQALDQKMLHPDVSLLHRLSSVFSVPPVRPSEGAQVSVNMLAHVALDMADVMAGARYVATM
ncbi:MAG: hypothetical protein BM485_03365 [Desulfobulbaceae bacterium DB1]|nr:MAG: hypothetical protein BM485_03365 [Desulfobulbaceae bacterium DB1]